jgi:hypothetical protein
LVRLQNFGVCKIYANWQKGWLSKKPRPFLPKFSFNDFKKVLLIKKLVSRLVETASI